VLDAQAVLTLLVERGLLERAEILDGEVRIVDASRRNRNLHVLRRRQPSYVFKQGLGIERRETVAHEAAIYDYFHAIETEPLAAVLARVAAYLPNECVLLLEFVNGAVSLERARARHGRYSTVHARRLADALSIIHCATATTVARRAYEQRFPAGAGWRWPPPHRLDVHMLHAISNGATLAIRMIQSSKRLCDLLDAIGTGSERTCLIHGDLRLDNCLVSTAPQSTIRGRVTIVDWELAGWGDPCIDAGAVLASYLRSWLLSNPINGETPLDAVIEMGHNRLADMQRAAGAFWSTYHARMRLLDATSLVSLRRSMQLAALRLLQFMFEELQASTELTAQAVCLSQLAFNLLERPEAAAEHFLALPVAA
jgi:hypothetical protein